MLSAGSLRRRITLQARAVTQDGFGGQSTTWTDVATVWASLEPAGGQELLAAQAMQLEQPSTITLRWQSALSDPKAVVAMRAVYGTRIFNIHACLNEAERNRVIVLICSEGLNEG